MAAVYTRPLRAELAASQRASQERALYLAAVDACLQPRREASPRMLSAYRALRSWLDAHGAGLHAPALAGVAVAWAERARDLIAAEVDAVAMRLDCDRGEVDRRDLRAALLLWAAAEAWASVDPAAEASGRWSALGALAADLATALDGAVDRGAGGLVTGAAAQRVRAVMADVWARETGR